MKKTKRIITLVMALALATTSLAACQSSTPSSSSTASESSAAESASESGSEESSEGEASAVDTSEKVELTYYLWGSEGPANPATLEEINTKLEADINATLKINYIDWGDIATKYPLLFASGEQFDMSHVSTNAVVSYLTLAADGVLYDMTESVKTVTPTLYEALPENNWKSVEYNGAMYAVPTNYSEFTPASFVYRADIKDGAGIEGDIDSIEDMEIYLDYAKTMDMVPMNLAASDAEWLYKMMVESTGSWISSPGLPLQVGSLVATSAEDYADIIHPAFTDEFLEFATMMREWADKEYWPVDVMAATENGKDNTVNGLSSAYITHQPDWTGTYGQFEEKLPGIQIDAYAFAEEHGKIIQKAGVENGTAIYVDSENPERALMAIEKFMTDESYYNLIQFGREGVQYELVDGKITEPEAYNAETDGGGFAVWSLRNDEFEIPRATEDERRYSLNEEWKETSIPNPYVGFAFDDSNISTELAAIANVNTNLGVQLMFGKTSVSVEEAVQQYRDELTQAGIETVIEEVKAQLANFTPIA